MPTPAWKLYPVAIDNFITAHVMPRLRNYCQVIWYFATLAPYWMFKGKARETFPLVFGAEYSARWVRGERATRQIGGMVYVLISSPLPLKITSSVYSLALLHQEIKRICTINFKYDFSSKILNL